jgi:hypothetical protein
MGLHVRDPKPAKEHSSAAIIGSVFFAGAE